jgi:hypothetical protein
MSYFLPVVRESFVTSTAEIGDMRRRAVAASGPNQNQQSSQNGLQ